MAIVGAALRAFPAVLGPRGKIGQGPTGHTSAQARARVARSLLRCGTSSIAWRYTQFALRCSVERGANHGDIPARASRGKGPEDIVLRTPPSRWSAHLERALCQITVRERYLKSPALL
jgi:hypothetical protein